MVRPFMNVMPATPTAKTVTTAVPMIELASLRSNGRTPSTTRLAMSVTTITASIDSRPSWDQYTSSSRSQRANSSIVSPAPIPNPTAVICHHGE
jgi:hypothetical protein